MYLSPLSTSIDIRTHSIVYRSFIINVLCCVNCRQKTVQYSTMEDVYRLLQLSACCGYLGREDLLLSRR